MTGIALNAPGTLGARIALLTLIGTAAIASHCAWSQSATQALPPTLRACLAEADRDRRLDCFDRESARLIMPPDRPAASEVASPAGLAPAASRLAGPPPAALPPPKNAAPPSATHFSARVARIEHGGGLIVVHLDNGQAWEQAISGDTDLSMRPGDAVKVDRELGDWWLTDRYGETLQVRLAK